MREFTFIRHCQSQGNAGFTTHQPQSIALTEKGVSQSEFVAGAFETAPDLIVTSPFVRTKQSAKPLILKFPEARCEEWKVEEFSYLSNVKYADTTVEYRRPFVRDYWMRCDVDYCDGDGTESFAQFIFRVEAVLAKISETEQKKVVVFTHGQFMKAVLWVLVNNFPEINRSSMDGFHSFQNGVLVPNASIFKVFVADGKFLLGGISTRHLPPELITL
jgi:broad specificity phosphatase PhoE